jgi:S1-C subfamily serine protease
MPAAAMPAAVMTAPPARSRGVLAPIALVLSVLLLIVVVAQAVLLVDTRGRLDDSQRRAAAAQVAADERIKGLETRTKELERRSGNSLDAAAVAGDVVPSVFLVLTPQGQGSGFAFGPDTADGGTYLITNAHVVQEEWDRGVRQVALEQKNRRFTAKILKVETGVDLALLSVAEKFPRLLAAPEAAKPGQPVVVVGAPLGVEDVVTSGVISTIRPGQFGEALQFDAAINPGNSGGPLVNAQKQVVGVVNAKQIDADGFSLGIPVATVCKTFSLC